MTDTPLAVKEPSRLPDQLLRYPGFVTLVSLNHGPGAQDTGDLDAPERSRKALALSENARVRGDITGQVGRVYLRLQASAGGLGTYLPQVRGDHVRHTENHPERTPLPGLSTPPLPGTLRPHGPPGGVSCPLEANTSV